MKNDIIIRDKGLQPYQSTWQAMRDFTDTRTEDTPDEIWLLEHPCVFTQGVAGKAEHILNAHNIPVVQTDRGGQVTYHGPGQLVIYPLINLKRINCHARKLVTLLEESVVTYLKTIGIESYAKCDAPGVYVADAKICSIGLRIRKGASYHGIALNVDMDLTPFHYINPCGYQGMQMTQIKRYAPNITFTNVKSQLTSTILEKFGYNQREFNLTV